MTKSILPQHNLQGKTFGNWTVLSYAEVRTGRRYWNCLCSCGSTGMIRASAMLDGTTKSCGCIGMTKHGLSSSSEYMIWANIKARCYNKNSQAYYNYGARGIIMCDAWLNSFEVFIKDMGMRPTLNHEIDRIDNNGNYEPENCRWVTRSTNQCNTRTSKWWWIDGVRYESMAHAAKSLGVSEGAVYSWCSGYSTGGKQYNAKDGCYCELKYKSNNNKE